MKSKRCIHKFKDEGCIKATALAVSPNGLYLACGYVYNTSLYECRIVLDKKREDLECQSSFV
jgi:hypothetical protein